MADTFYGVTLHPTAGRIDTATQAHTSYIADFITSWETWSLSGGTVEAIRDGIGRKGWG